MSDPHSFRVSFVSSSKDLAVPVASQILAKVRSGPFWDEASILPEDDDFPRMHVAWLEDRGYIVHCFEDDAASGDFLTINAEFSDPTVQFNLGGQALERWPAQLFVAEELASRAVEIFLDFGRQDPAQQWVGTGAFPRDVVWEGREQREAWERAHGQECDA